MVWSVIPPRKVYWVVVVVVVVVSGWQTKFSVSPGPGLWSLVLGLLDLTWDLTKDLTWNLDLSLTIMPTEFHDCRQSASA